MKLFNRSFLKWLALITMLIDHIGAVIGEEVFASWNLLWLYQLLRTIGRISFPIFAFFIAEGWYYTNNKKRYSLLILLFALISQPIYYFAISNDVFALNILFTFLLSLLIFYLIDLCKKSPYNTLYACLIVLIIFAIFIGEMFGISVSYGLYGVFLPVIFYLFYHSDYKYSKLIMWLTIALFIIVYWLLQFLTLTEINFFSFHTLFTLIAIPFLLLYNGEKGKYSLKWLFYIFYPTHLLVLYLITLLV